MSIRKETRTKIIVSEKARLALEATVTAQGKPVTKETMTEALRQTILNLEESLNKPTNKP